MNEQVDNDEAAARRSRVFQAAAFVVLTLATLAVYARTFGYGYVLLDDDRYVFQNPNVQHGLSIAGLQWAFTTFWCANWHPLTWITLMLDSQFFGLHPGEQHAVNVFLHLASALLLFVTLWKITRHPWRCALVAGVFALHPVHVESVAWIAERKDVLSTFFEFVTLALYVNYVEHPNWKRYAAVAVAFGLALLSKPMVVTLPFALLLLDFWPLKRLTWPIRLPAFARLFREKLLLLVLSLAACLVTYLAQSSVGAVISAARYPIAMRLGNAAIAYARYLGKTFWPVDLAILYPRAMPDARAVAGSLLLLILATVIAVRGAERRPYLLVGWLWFIGMLVPVIGLVQVGAQSIADRYLYVPMVGISFALIWCVAEAVEDHPWSRGVGLTIAIGVLAACAAVSYRQVGYWSSSRNVFTHALTITDGNYVIEDELGRLSAREGDYEGAMRMYRRSLANNPDWPVALVNLGTVFVVMGRPAEAIAPLEKALRNYPNFAPAHAQLGVAFAALKRFDESREHLETALRENPNDAVTEGNLCYALRNMGLLDQAVEHCQAALRLDPDSQNTRHASERPQ